MEGQHTQSASYRRRYTFTAVSFKTLDSRPGSAYALAYLYCENGRVKNEGCLDFLPTVSCAGEVKNADLFENVFEKIRPYVTRSDVPVLIWDDRALQIFEGLTLYSGMGLVMQRPPRYFKVKDYAVRRLGRKARGWEWPEIAAHYELSGSVVAEPDAAQLARLMEKIEESVAFPSVVAKAFCCFCDSILEDKVVTLNEAVELRAFVSLISDKYTEFKKLEDVLDDVLDDGVVTEAESARLVRILEGMKKFYSKFIVSVCMSEK